MGRLNVRNLGIDRESIPDGRVFGRDASFWAQPNTRDLKRYHWPSDRYPGVSACGHVVLNFDVQDIPEMVPDGLRCKRSGCRGRWAA